MSINDQAIQGGRELDRLLNTLPAKIHANILRTALSAGAKVFKDEARRLVPTKTGNLRKSIRVSSRINGRKGQVTASVKAGSKAGTKNAAPYAVLVEYGTRSHQVKAPPGRALRFGSITVVEVDHPGATSKPFMRPAVDNGFQKAIATIQRHIRGRLNANGINTPGPIMDDPE